MGIEEDLQKYLTGLDSETRVGGATRQRIEELFDKLSLPWDRDDDGDWIIKADVGPVQAMLDDAGEVLTFWQAINKIDTPAEDNGTLYQGLLQMNSQATGAAFALLQPTPEDVPILGIVGRISAKDIDSSEIALSLHSVFEMSALFD